MSIYNFKKISTINFNRITSHKSREYHASVRLLAENKPRPFFLLQNSSYAHRFKQTDCKKKKKLKIFNSKLILSFLLTLIKFLESDI